ncbi:nitrate/sulfonate/bicarbonate ABC transporter ATP-binding protein [Patulibacter medicamentivorans]|uniref:Nitrate/sulfonate/bicarbonate ABC transporter ATP-binding protein n=1 Tax=Patulibacter medicamentivorans TaxID=1097667 RepID=H0EB41_9ACTN|nr:ABC transporter ATP-binding protein [Patulibacter medicamentivorans]EHN09116.1 nitrate/sulfonate/bicarbonate ABC transporter ATP-binding protein [Patulibacter medicamentivorans]
MSTPVRTAPPVSATAADPDAAVVALDGVGKTFANGTAALADVQLEVAPGELVSFVGPSGCGKSTVFRLIAGLADPTRGTVSVMGTSPQRARRDGSVAYVFQDPTLLPWASVRDNVALPLRLRGDGRRERAAAADRALELVGLDGHERDLPRQLSGGMRMRVSIARALVSRPRLLLMDEPFGALDEITRQALQGELLRIWRQADDMTVLFVTHNVFEAVYLSTRIAVMAPRPGRIAAALTVAEPYPREAAFRTSPQFSAAVAEVGAALHASALPAGASAPATEADRVQ